MAEANLREQLEALNPKIEQLLSISGAPALSLGVIHYGEIIHTAHFGRRDATVPESTPNDDTIYRIASLTKGMTAAVIASLVDEGILSWDEPVHRYLPELAARQDDVGQKATLIDVLANRSGLGLCNLFWGQQHGIFLCPKSEIIRTVCTVEAVRPFRSFVYTNRGYGIATEIIERVTGKSFGRNVKERLTDPLGMSRTTIAIPEAQNMAYNYTVNNDGTPVKIPFTDYSDSTGLAGGGAGKSSIGDLLKMYQSMLSAYNHQKRTGSTSTPGSPFKQLNTMFTPHVAVNNRASLKDVGYCLGLYRSRLPANLGSPRINNMYLGQKAMPITGHSLAGVEVWHHNGNLPGFLASAFLVPSTETVVVGLSNSLGFFDPTDFACQLILSTTWREKPVDYVQLAKKARKMSLASYAFLASKVEEGETDTPPKFPLSAYEGYYFNDAGNFVPTVEAEKDGLLVRVQGLADVWYRLYPFDGETFYWPADREWELCEKGMFPYIFPEFHKITFRADEMGIVTELLWKHDPMGKLESFRRKEDRQKGRRVKL